MHIEIWQTGGDTMPIVIVPMYEKYPEVKGVFVQGCVDRGDGSSFRRQAHAHTSKTYPNYGWICIRSPKRLTQKGLLIHELCHILTGDGHTDKWRAKVRELGGRLDFWETKEYFQLKRAGIRVSRKVGKRETQRLLKNYSR